MDTAPYVECEHLKMWADPRWATAFRRFVCGIYDLLHEHGGFITSFTAICATLITLWQISTQNEERREDEQHDKELKRDELAYHAYQNFLSLSLQYSDFSCIDTEKELEFLKKTTDKTSLVGNKLFVKYNLYRQMTLATMEEILLAQPDSPDWKLSVRLRLECHKAYLASKEFTAKPDERYKGWKCVTRSMIFDITRNPVVKCSDREEAQESLGKIF